MVNMTCINNEYLLKTDEIKSIDILKLRTRQKWLTKSSKPLNKQIRRKRANNK